MKAFVLALALGSASAFVVPTAPRAESALSATLKAAPKAALKAAVKAPVKAAVKAPVKAAAKAPVKSVARAKKVSSSSYGDALGAQAPLGFWDPLGMVANVDQERFDRLRGVELKHGRVSMLAFLGHVTTSAGVHFSGKISDTVNFADIKPGLAAFQNLPPYGALQIVLFIGWLEAFVMRDLTGTAEFPGDYRNGFIDFGWDTFSDSDKLKKRSIELNNGRAAQMGILGLMMHEVVTGNPYQPFF